MDKLITECSEGLMHFDENAKVGRPKEEERVVAAVREV